MDSPADDSPGPLSDIPTRPMRVKVLYTFDSENKTNCLARFSETHDIPAVSIDEKSQVGVIDLRQCIQAVLSASPEILSKLDTEDFTIYAFDYSEYDTPLVGQGRLSSLLASTPTTVLPPQQSQTMITGRICQNVPALFNNGVKEILEVKLRLTPVSKPTQNEYSRTADSFRSMSPATSAGFDPNAWNASLQQNKALQQSNEYFSFDTLHTGDDNASTLLEDMFGINSASSGDGSGIGQPGGVGMSETPADGHFAYNNPAFTVHSHSAPGSRSGSPITAFGPSIRSEHLRHQSFSGSPLNMSDQSRPNSRASVRSEVNASTYHLGSSAPNEQSQSADQELRVFYNEDGQPRKRAKVTQTDWRGRSSFGGRTSDLRVAASKAASMQLHRPVPQRPVVGGGSLEPPPRVPTPVPIHASVPHQRTHPASAGRSMLRQASVVDSDMMSDCEPMSDASPEGISPGESAAAADTPVDIPSSPPLLPTFNHPQLSSPGLPPRVSHMADSGYMSERGLPSGSLMESFDDNDNAIQENEDIGLGSMQSQRPSKRPAFVKTESPAPDAVSRWPDNVAFSSEMNVQIEEPGDMNQLPQKMLLNIPPPKRDGSQGPRQQRPAMPRRTGRQGTSHGSPPDESRTPASDAAQSRRGSLALPSKPLDSALYQSQKPKQQSFQRSNTFNDSEAGSPAPSDNEGRPRGPNRSGSGAQRRKVIEQRLQDSIAKGVMPQFCSHCGAIETPTWRKLYVKYVDGKPGVLDSVEGEGETIGVEPVDVDENTGEVTKFVIRKSMKKTKDSLPGPGFEDKLVCNPCGLWFNKFRQMRPSDKWGRKATTRRSKKPKRDDGLEPASEAFFTDQVGPEDSAEEPPLANETENDTERGRASSSESLPEPEDRLRSKSTQSRSFRAASDNSHLGRHLDEIAHSRPFQSSPIRLPGSQGEPIELDLTPKPTRRLLFPSPRQSNEVKSLENDKTASAKSKLGNSVKEKLSLPQALIINPDQTDLDVFGVFTHDKENLVPCMDDTDDLTHLFEDSPSGLFKTPLRKTPSKRSPPSREEMSQLLKTPTPGNRKRKALDDNPNAANNGAGNANDFMTSPSSSRYFLRSTPSRLERTPGGRSASGTNAQDFHEVSPFSRQLALVLGDAGQNSDANFTSPSRPFDFSDLPTFTTPGHELDWKGLDDILSSDFAIYDTCYDDQNATASAQA